MSRELKEKPLSVSTPSSTPHRVPFAQQAVPVHSTKMAKGRWPWRWQRPGQRQSPRITVPKLDRNRAVVATTVSTEVGEAHDIPVSEHIFFTDSVKVLYWLRSQRKRFDVDIGRRISSIEEVTSASQWWHVPRKQTEVDKETCWISGVNLVTDQSWRTGPEFHQHCAEEWPHMWITVPDQLPGEARKKLAMNFTTSGNLWRFETYSSWKRPVRVTSNCGASSSLAAQISSADQFDDEGGDSRKVHH